MYRLGIDVGGTNIVAGIVDENYKIISTSKRKTNSPRPVDSIISDIAAIAFDAINAVGLKKEDIDAAGIGIPGSIDISNGLVCMANNIGFFNVPIVKILKEKTAMEFYLVNDANAAAYGEFIAGAGVGSKDFIMITLGTGVGGGIIINGKIYSGSNNAGGELGHTVISIDGEMCSCGRQGCWEAYASATALIRQTKQAMKKYPNTVMWKLCKKDINAVNGLTAFEAMRQGDIVAKDVVDKYIKYIAVGIANNINIFQPEIICIGGGISNEGDNIIVPIKQYVDGENYARNIEKKVQITTAKLGDDAGIIGAAYICDLYRK